MVLIKVCGSHLEKPSISAELTWETWAAAIMRGERVFFFSDLSPFYSVSHHITITPLQNLHCSGSIYVQLLCTLQKNTPISYNLVSTATNLSQAEFIEMQLCNNSDFSFHAVPHWQQSCLMTASGDSSCVGQPMWSSLHRHTDCLPLIKVSGRALVGVRCNYCGLIMKTWVSLEKTSHSTFSPTNKQFLRTFL